MNVLNAFPEYQGKQGIHATLVLTTCYVEGVQGVQGVQESMRGAHELLT